LRQAYATGRINQVAISLEKKKQEPRIQKSRLMKRDFF
jgi:hypothetical protein